MFNCQFLMILNISRWDVLEKQNENLACDWKALVTKSRLFLTKVPHLLESTVITWSAYNPRINAIYEISWHVNSLEMGTLTQLVA